MARFTLRGAEYELVDSEDLTLDEISEMETYTGFDMVTGKVSFPGLIWISVRRRIPNTTWDDIKGEKLGGIEVLEDEEEERLPPISNGDAAHSTVDAPTARLARIDTGNPG